MTTLANINGVTHKQMTSMMINLEKRINWFNKKYNFDPSQAPAKDVKSYNADLASWDLIKAKRDSLN